MTSPPILQSGLLASLPGVRHAFFTRQGGVSGGIYESLNLGPGSRDEAAAVAENRRRAAAVFGARPEALNICWQIHSTRVVVAEHPFGPDRPEADGVITRHAGLVCGALAADCAPVLIAEPRARIVAAVHAGWRGALAGVVEAAVRAMTAMGGRPSAMAAAVGPCIAQPSYEVGLEFLDRFVSVAPNSSRFFGAGVSADKRQFDLPGFVLSRLEAAGVGASEWVGHDTCAGEALFFSNRRAVKRGEGDYGRLLSAIMLEPET
jgi:YfiH family protein